MGTVNDFAGLAKRPSEHLAGSRRITGQDRGTNRAAADDIAPFSDSLEGNHLKSTLATDFAKSRHISHPILPERERLADPQLSKMSLVTDLRHEFFRRLL